MNDERRHFMRLRAPMLCRPRGLGLFKQRAARDVSMGGVRIYSDDPVKVGTKLEIEMFLQDRSSIVAGVEVVWVDELGEDKPARFDVGLKFLELKPEDHERLEEVLSHTDPGLS